ncbi:MAG: cell division protein FtsW [Gemmatimonadales bacterium]|nr:MAG: cell division protein FtsW [Gemmatimonadales bacterium]
MTPVRTDIAPRSRPTLPDSGIPGGWEPAALMLATLLLLGFGLVNLYSASAFLAARQELPDSFYVLRQATGAAVGLVLLAVAARIPYTWWRTLAWPLLVGVFGALLLTVLPFTTGIAPEINGARRWLNLGVTLQPAEFAKIAIIVWTAHMAVKKRARFRSLSQGLMPFLVVWSILLVPILLQPDLSTAFVLALLGALVVFGAGARIGHFVFLAICMAPLAWIQLGTGFRAERLRAFGNLDQYAGAAGYQVRQSLIALGSGGPTGVGFGEGRQKFGFLPEPHNDFIFSMIGEEWGFLGTAGLLLAYLAIVVIGFRIARRAPDLFGQLLALGFTNLIALHALLHAAVGLGVIPPTGLPLPLVSYGRSHLLVTLVGMGVLLSVARGDPSARPEPEGELPDAAISDPARAHV